MQFWQARGDCLVSIYSGSMSNGHSFSSAQDIYGRSRKDVDLRSRRIYGRWGRPNVWATSAIFGADMKRTLFGYFKYTYMYIIYT